MAGVHLLLLLPAHYVDGDGVRQEAAPLPPSAQSDNLRGHLEVPAPAATGGGYLAGNESLL